MLKYCFNNLQRSVGFINILQPSVSITVIVKRLQFTKEFENVKKITENKDNKLDEIRKYRNAEAYLWYGSGYRSINPELIAEEQWEHLYGLDTKHQRQKYLRYLHCRVEAKAEQKKSAEEKREASKLNRKTVLAERGANEHIVYGVGHDSPLIRISKRIINRWYNIKLLRAKLYGQKIVVDCSYENHMSNLECCKVVKSLERSYSENRKHMKPLDLNICGVPSDSAIIKKLSDRIPNLLNKGSLTSVNTKCFAEMFPKDRLVILTPDSPNVLEYKSDDIYVIGGIVELGRNDPMTLAKARRLGIRHARLPLEKLRMRPGDCIHLPLSSTAAVIREFQINKNLKEVLQKTVYLRSKTRENREKYEKKKATRYEGRKLP